MDGDVSMIGMLTALPDSFPSVSALIKPLNLQGLPVGNRRQQQAMMHAIHVNGLHPVVNK